MLSLTKTTINLSSTDAYLDDDIILEFNKDLNPTTLVYTGRVRTANLYLVPIDISLPYQRFSGTFAVVDGNKIVVKPGTIYAPNATYSIVITSGTSGVLASDSDYLTENITINFDTGTKLKPVQDQSVEVTAEQLNTIAKATTDFTESPLPSSPREIVIPDIDPQGGIKPFIPCSPSFGSNSLEIIPGDSGVPSVIATSRLILSGSIPAAFTVGILDVSEVQLIWQENIQSIIPDDSVELSWQDLPSPDNPFLVNSINRSGLPLVLDANITQAFTPVVGFNITNKEFTVKVKAGKAKSIDGTKTNLTENYVFSGPLVPMLCSVDQAKAGAGMWASALTDRDIYYYYKIIHEESVYALTLSGYSDVASVPLEELIRLKRYVCCSASLRMLAFGSPDATGGSGGGAVNPNIFVKKRELPGVAVTYESFSSSSSSNGDTSPIGQMIKRLNECIKNNAPSGSELNELGPYGIKRGIKSIQDRSMPIRRRL